MMENTNKNLITIYTDGACSYNRFKSSFGGWSFIIKFDNDLKEIHSAGFEKETTSQRMELISIINALEYIKEKLLTKNLSIIIYSDSQYAIKGASSWMYNWYDNNWMRIKNDKKLKINKKLQVKNLDLWKKIFELTKILKPKFIWIKGHSGNSYNELCDKLAVTALKMQSNYFTAIRMPSH